jgi:periplasmic protein TonB
MRRRLIGLALSGMLHAAVILTILALVRFTAEPILFVDLAQGLDIAEQAVSDLRRAVANVRSRVSARSDGGSRSKPTTAPSAPASSAVAMPAPPHQAEPPALPPSPPPEPVRSAPEPSRPVEPPRAVTEVTSAPQARSVEVTPSASAGGESVAASAPTTARAPAGGDHAGRATSGAGAPGGSGSLNDVGGGPTGSDVRSGSRDGGALALAVPGSGGGDRAAADYAGYYDTLRRRLYESLTYPTMARRRSLTGTVIVDVEIDASGKVGRLTLVNSSSHAMLDEAALDALRAVSRVPFPPGVPPRRLLVRLPVVFEIR